MDTIQNQKKKKKRSGHTLEKQSRDNTSESIENDKDLMNGEVIKMAEDLKDLPEFDWENPDMKKWAEKQEERWRRNWQKRMC